MKNIEINISNKIATLKEKFVGVCGNSDYVVAFNFDDEWKSHATKTARFKHGGQYTDVVFTGNECPMPIILDTASVEIGVYAGNLHTTTSACVLMKTCILSGSGVPADPTPDVYNQIIEKIDAGMLKGDKGDKGEKGDPGSDASVTTENIESALGYAPVRDVQVSGSSVLEDGVANIKANTYQGVSFNSLHEIVLFPADTDVLTTRVSNRAITPTNLDYAVKSAMCDGKGAAWTSAEQKAARERMGIDKEYELIEEITLTENVTEFTRTDEPDGTPYAFEMVAIKINRTNTGEGGVYVYSGSTVLGWSYLSVSGQYFACETFSLHGYWQNYRYSASSGHNDYNSIAPSGDSRFLKIKKVAGQYVSKIQITLNGGELGIGTKISIYGVRA